MSPRARKKASPPVGQQSAETVRSEHELRTGVERVEAGRIRARKQIDYVPTEQRFGTGIESADVERSPVSEGDSGQVETLPDGSVSIPLFEERLVVEKQVFVTERIIIRKRTEMQDQVVSADLGRERIVIESDPQPADRIIDDRPPTQHSATASPKKPQRRKPTK